MDLLLLIARLLHIVLGVFWAGTLFFSALFLLPSIRDAGPDGAKVVAGLLKRRFVDVLPAAAILTVLSGFWLYWYASAGFQPEYMGSRPGMWYGTGGLTAVIGLVIGLAVVRPSMLKAAALGQSAASLPAGEKEAALAQAGALRARAAKANRVIAVLLGITLVTMALGRYV
jgi:hypothetical protein